MRSNVPQCGSRIHEQRRQLSTGGTLHQIPMILSVISTVASMDLKINPNRWFSIGGRDELGGKMPRGNSLISVPYALSKSLVIAIKIKVYSRGKRVRERGNGRWVWDFEEFVVVEIDLGVSRFGSVSPGCPIVFWNRNSVRWIELSALLMPKDFWWFFGHLRKSVVISFVSAGFRCKDCRFWMELVMGRAGKLYDSIEF